jgi:UDP-N-acetylmuramoyl-L-alanyl-D-glutamate--2,6-diaminopimelate ligase
MDNYRDAKARLFSQSKFGVVNADDESSSVMLKFLGGNPYFTYGIENAADLKVGEYDVSGSRFKLNDTWFDLPVHGKFNVYNALAAIGTAQALGIETDEIRKAVAKLGGVPGRIQSVPNNRGLRVFIDYAHSPDGLKNIIEAVRGFTDSRVITVFGCGGGKDKTKRSEMGKIAGRLSDYCILTSDNPRNENPFEIIAQIEEGIKQTAISYEIIENRADAISAGVKMLTPQDSLIIAGKGHEDYQIIGNTKYHFDDFETAAKELGV